MKGLTASIILYCIILAGLHAAMHHDFAGLPSSTVAQAKPFHAYTDQWQRHNDAKLAMCYQKMATQEAVNYCLFKLNVFI